MCVCVCVCVYVFVCVCECMCVVFVCVSVCGQQLTKQISILSWQKHIFLSVAILKINISNRVSFTNSLNRLLYGMKRLIIIVIYYIPSDKCILILHHLYLADYISAVSAFEYNVTMMALRYL